MSTKDFGDFGEKIACEYLVKKGYKILCRNYRINFGEIDIIAQKRFSLYKFFQGRQDKTIHFIEVKTSIKGNNNFSPEDRVNYKKQDKLRKLCLFWLSKNKMPQNYPYQIDVAGIIVGKNLDNPEISYFENAVTDI